MEKILAFAMGQHARLGHVSIVQNLGMDCVRLVMLCYFRLPVDYLSRQHVRDEYKSMLRLLNSEGVR